MPNGENKDLTNVPEGLAGGGLTGGALAPGGLTIGAFSFLIGI
jgi:hypothetical protein